MKYYSDYYTANLDPDSHRDFDATDMLLTS